MQFTEFRNGDDIHLMQYMRLLMPLTLHFPPITTTKCAMDLIIRISFIRLNQNQEISQF